MKKHEKAEDKLACYLEGRAGLAANQILDCARDPSKRMDCLQKLLPPGAQKAIEIGRQCSGASKATEYMSCAQSLGLKIDPKVGSAINCAGKGNWGSAAGCIAEQNVGGVAGQIAACYSDGAASGGEAE